MAEPASVAGAGPVTEAPGKAHKKTADELPVWPAERCCLLRG